MKKLFSIALAVTSMSYLAQAQVNTNLPYSIDFESLSALTNDASWTQASTATTVITNIGDYRNGATLNTAYMGTPMSGTHAKVLSFADAPITNSYTNGTAYITMDAMIRPSIAQDLVYNAAVSNSHFSVSFMTNGIALWHGSQSVAGTYGADSANWFTETSISISSSKWVRMTISLNYKGAPMDIGDSLYNAMFQVKVDGIPLTAPEGHVIADMLSATNGSWFLMAPTTYVPTTISMLTLDGSGMLDDLMVNTVDVPDYVTQNRHIPYNWMVLSGVTNDTSSGAMSVAEGDSADADGDGSPNWMEYYAGTQPTNPASCLVIVNQALTNGAVTLKWLGTSAALAPYSIALSTNLTAWTTITNNLVRLDGTNTLVAPSIAVSPAFYRVQVIK